MDDQKPNYIIVHGSPRGPEFWTPVGHEKRWSTWLKSNDFLTMPAGVAQGYFGSLTKQALISYQKSVGLPATGYCGPMTRAMINAGQ